MVLLKFGWGWVVEWQLWRGTNGSNHLRMFRFTRIGAACGSCRPDPGHRPPVRFGSTQLHGDGRTRRWPERLRRLRCKRWWCAPASWRADPWRKWLLMGYLRIKGCWKMLCLKCVLPENKRAMVPTASPFSEMKVMAFRTSGKIMAIFSLRANRRGNRIFLTLLLRASVICRMHELVNSFHWQCFMIIACRLAKTKLFFV